MMWWPSLWNWSIDGILDHGQEIWSMKVLCVALRANIDAVCLPRALAGHLDCTYVVSLCALDSIDIIASGNRQ